MASLGVTLAKLKDNLTCPLCYEVFEEDDRQPKGLPCYHSICYECLDRYVKKNTEEDYHCPMCQAIFTVPRDGVEALPTNVSLKNMLELLPDEKNNNEDDLLKPVCQQHGCKECVFVCRECRVGLCNSCITTMKSGPHYPHMEEVSELDAAMDDLKRLAEVDLKKLDGILQSHEDALVKLLNWKTSIKQDVKERAEKVITSVKDQQKTLETEIDALYDDNVKEIEGLKINSIQTKKELTLKLTQMQQMCRNYDFGVYQVKDEIEKTLTDTNKDMNTILQSKIPTLSVTGIPFPVDIGCVSDNTFRMFLVVNDVLGLDQGNLGFRSQTWYFHSLPWKIYTRLDSNKDGKRYLGLYMECETPTWTCEARFEGSLLTYKEGRHHYTQTPKSTTWHWFSHKAATWGWRNFIAWNKLTDPAHGYVKDNSFTVVATVTVKPPHRG